VKQEISPDRYRGETKMKIDENTTMILKTNNFLMGRSLALIVLLLAMLISLRLVTFAQSSTPSQLTITVSSQGMTPSTATVSSGVVHLLVKNSSSVETLRLKVTRESGELVRELTAPNKSEDWAIELELSAGQYVISESSNTSWNCRLTAQAPPPSGGAWQHP
jgi:hypothetical protein